VNSTPIQPYWVRVVIRTVWFTVLASLVATILPIWCVSNNSGWCHTPSKGFFWSEVNNVLFDYQATGWGQMVFNFELLFIIGCVGFLLTLPISVLNLSQ
jgi:hypothetical protein